MIFLLQTKFLSILQISPLPLAQHCHEYVAQNFDCLPENIYFKDNGLLSMQFLSEGTQKSVFHQNMEFHQNTIQNFAVICNFAGIWNSAQSGNLPKTFPSCVKPSKWQQLKVFTQQAHSHLLYIVEYTQLNGPPYRLIDEVVYVDYKQVSLHEGLVTCFLSVKPKSIHLLLVRHYFDNLYKEYESKVEKKCNLSMHDKVVYLMSLR